MQYEDRCLEAQAESNFKNASAAGKALPARKARLMSFKNARPHDFAPSILRLLSLANASNLRYQGDGFHI